MKTIADIDIDVADRDLVLENIKHIPATQITKDKVRKHVVGVYFHNVPKNPFTGTCSIDYEQAEERGFFKIDILNLSVYEKVKNEEHLLQLIETEPLWEMLEEPTITDQLNQINGDHAKKLLKMYKPRSVEELAIIIALIRPGKVHLIGESIDYIRKHIWEKSEKGEYSFKKSHAISYALSIVVQMNLMVEELG